MEKEIEIPFGTSIDEAVEILLKKKEEGEKVFCVFNRHTLHSEDVTLDSAYLEVLGYTKAEYDNIMKRRREEYLRSEKIAKSRKAGYERRAKENRTEDKPITILDVIEGLRFIAENQDLDQEALFEGLIAMGCDFSLEDIKKQYPNTANLYEGMKKGLVAAGATVIVNSRDSEFGREYNSDWFLSSDNESSIYNYIRITTGDSNYTKEYVDSLKDEMKL